MSRCFSCTKLVQIKTWGFYNVLFLLEKDLLSFKRTLSQPFSTASAPNESSFTVDYLMNSCGLSPQAALSASKRINLKSPEQPNSVLALLTSHSFDKTHIRDLITKHPLFLLSSPDKTLKPKFQFFLDLGFSLSNLPQLIVSNPSLFHSSLTKKIKPSVELLRGFLHTNEDIIKAIKRSQRLLTCDLHELLVPKVSILQSHGIPNSAISRFILSHPRRFIAKTDKFNEIISRVKELGFDSSAPSMFIMAAMMICSMSKSTWEGKMAVFRSLGWSDEDIRSAFRKQPFCMMLSEKKIRTTVDFFTNELNWEPSRLSSCPNVLLYSLETRIIPRYRVIQILMSKDLIKKKLGLTTILSMSEKRFLGYVTKYLEELPDVLQSYQSRMGAIGS